MDHVITTYAAAKKYNLSTRYIRVLLAKNRIKGHKSPINEKTEVWLVDEASLKRFLSTERKVGRPKKNA